MAEQTTQSTVKADSPKKPIDKPVELWSKSEVKSWLQVNGLQKFFYLVDKYKITGKDLKQLKLDFLNDASVSVEDREVFLSEIYRLVKPTVSDMTRRSDDRGLHSGWEREKYQAALQVARGHTARSQSAAVLCADSSSWAKPNSRCLFDSLKLFGPRCVQCVQLSRSDNGFGFTCCMSSQGLVTVLAAPSLSALKKGDVILEMNGILLTRGDNSMETIAERMMRNSQFLQLVYLRDIRNSFTNTAEDVNVNHQLCSSERKWRKLQDILYSMKSEPVDTARLLSEIPEQQIWDMKHKFSEQANIDQMKDELEDKENTIQDLQRALAMKSQEVKMIERQRDAALAKFHSPASNITETRNSHHHPDTYKPLWEKFESDEVSKDDMLRCLKDLMSEAGQQKSCFDRLLSVVIQKAPELLEEVDTGGHDPSSTHSSDTEQFC